MRTAILFSGRGSNMEALLEAGPKELDFVLCATDNPEAGGRALAARHHLPCELLTGDQKERERRLLRLLRRQRVELVLLAGFMRVLSASLVEAWYGRILNIHPSLLPDFKGLNPQAQALAAGVSKSGASVHLVTAELDSGPVLGQAEVPVLPGDDQARLAARILRAEHQLYPRVAAEYAAYLQSNPSGDAGLLKVPYSAIKEECGVFACHSPLDALALTIFGLHALQHRGQEGAGIATIHQGNISVHRRAGLVGEVFGKATVETLDLAGEQAIGHLRYSTVGAKDSANLQPFVLQTRFGPLALAHNGNLTNTDALRSELLVAGQSFFTDSDSEVFLHLISQSQHSELEAAFADACRQATGAFSLLLLSGQGIYAARDPQGMRPLCLGERDGQVAIASESTALEAADMEWRFDLDAGELVHIAPSGALRRSYYVDKLPRPQQRFCAFEYIYFMRANSAFNDRYTARVRERIGMRLWHEAPAPADFVVPVPESGIFAAIGYSQAAELPFHFAILKSSYVGRTFIEPEQSLRHFGVRLKLSVDRWRVRNKSIVLIDDSIVRGNTLPKLIELLRAAGAAEVHVRIASPTIEFPCFYGIDMPWRAELIAHDCGVEDIRRIIQADSLEFISVPGLTRAINANKSEELGDTKPTAERVGICTACFTGDYPVAISDASMQHELAGTRALYSSATSARPSNS